MTAPVLTPEFESKKAAPTLISPQGYLALCQQLLKDGVSQFKTKPVGAYLMKDIRVETLKSNGDSETVRDIKVEDVYILTDAEMYPLQAQRDLIMADIAKNWGERIVKQDELGKDYSAPGVWVNLKKKVDADYIPSADSKTLLVPNPEMTRLCLPLKEAVKVPVQWGTFDIDAEGTLAIRERDLEELLSAVWGVESGQVSIGLALYKQDEKGATVAKLDIYGMEPGFLKGNYNPVPLKPETVAMLKAYKASQAIAAPALNPN